MTKLNAIINRKCQRCRKGKMLRIFNNSINIPMRVLRERVNEIRWKPIVVHCAGAYRSATTSSLISSMINGQQKVLNIGEAIKDLRN